MRVYGRIYDEQGNPHWIEVDTDANGFNDFVYVTALAQCLKLTLGESPFYADYGIPGPQAVMAQIAPDFYVARTQQRYSGFFGNLIITREQKVIPPKTAPVPTYNVKIVTHQGVPLAVSLPI